MTIAEQLALEAKELNFEELPSEVNDQAKRSLLDSLAIAFGGYLSEPSRIIQNVIRELNGPAESTIFGTGLKTSCLYATLANGTMVHYFDYMDAGFLTKEATVIMGHHGELIAPILAVGERQHSGGEEIITTIVLAYELSNKLFDSLGGRTHGILSKRGWTTETVGPPCIMALLAGRLLGLDTEQMANALGIAGCFNLEPGILFTPRMTKNLRTPYGAYGGILAAFLAQKGFTGPLDVFEGPRGIAQVVAGGEMDLEKLRQPRKDWTILYTWIKNFAADGNMQGLLEATVNLVKEHDIKADDVAEIRVKTLSHIYRREANSPERQVPNNKYTADHSCRYVTAIAIMDRAVGPEQFSDEKLRDPQVRQLINKIVVEPDPELDGFHSPGIVEITTNKEKRYSCRVVHPKGHPMNPMTNADVEAKFTNLAGKFMPEHQMRRIIDTVHNLEKVDDIGELLNLLVIPAGSRSVKT